MAAPIIKLVGEFHTITSVHRSSSRCFSLTSCSLKSKKKTKNLKNTDPRNIELDLTNNSQIKSAKSFNQLLRERYREACRSVVVRTPFPKATVQALASHGSLRYAQYVSSDKQFIIAEFESENCVQRLLGSSVFFTEENKFPLASRCLYHNGRNKQRKQSQSEFLSEDNWHIPSSYPLLDTLDQELEALSRTRSLNDLDLRKRFLACVCAEDLVRPFLPEARIVPYGSCFNGFGWWDSDLDMMLCLQGDLHSSSNIKMPQHSSQHHFKFLTEVYRSDRLLAQKTLSMIASLLELAPRCNQVFKILNAHVPIVRFSNHALNLECDVSMESLDSLKMTELLHAYSTIDRRVRPLMAGIKQWALSQGLTAGGEQQKPTTIGLLTMLVFYLQTRQPAVLPTLKTLRNFAASADEFFIDNVVYGIPSNLSVVPKSENSESLESLLHGFFVFYSEFDFETKAISIIEGSTFTKSTDAMSPVYMENPLCIGHNICKNISLRYLEMFQQEMKIAAKKIESFHEGSLKSKTLSSLSELGRTPRINHERSRLGYLFSNDADDTEQDIILEVSELFDTESEADSSVLETVSELNSKGDNETHGISSVEVSSTVSAGGAIK